jgi:hypothetical protein
MQVIAFSTPSYPEWRWRILDYTGQMVEESRAVFPSIAMAVADGTRRLRQRSDDETAVPGYPVRGRSHQGRR